MLVPVKVRVALVGLIVAGGAAAAAALGPAGLAVGQSSQPIQVQVQLSSSGTLVARGAAVDVSVTASCSGQLVTSGSVGVNLTEPVGKNLAAGAGNAPVTCNGTAQTIQVVVLATAGKAFRTGSALAVAGISACTADFSSCGNQQVHQTIKIH